MAWNYGYGGYPAAGAYYAPPMPDQLAQLRQGTYQPPMNGQISQPFNQNVQAPQQPMNAQNNMPAPNGGIIWVSSEREAMEYPIAPNNAVALWDSNNPVIYLKQADASGKPSTEIYDLVKREPAPIVRNTPVQATQTANVEYVTRDEFNALEARFDALTTRETTKPKKQTKTVDEEDN